MLKLRPAKDRYLGITEADCLEILNLTPDQLKIARALDREKIFEIGLLLEDVARTFCEPPENYIAELDRLERVMCWLPTFDEEKADG